MKEKYITDTGKYLRISMRIDGGYFTKNITVSDFPSKAMAMEYARQIRDDALVKRRSHTLVRSIATVQNCFDKSIEISGYSDRTIHKHVHLYENGISEYASIPIQEITKADVLESVNVFKRSHTTDSVNRLITVWHKIFISAQLQGIPVIDYSEQIKPLLTASRVPVIKRPTTCETSEIQTFLCNLHGYRENPQAKISSDVMYQLCLCLYETGMRPMEAMALTKDDVDFKHNVIHVTKALGNVDRSHREPMAPKTPESIRDIPISQNYSQILHKYYENHDQNILFCDKTGDYITETAQHSFISRVNKVFGTHVTLYMLRHDFSTSLIKTNDLRTVQDLMGHASSSMTISYARSSEKDKRNAIENRDLKSGK